VGVIAFHVDVARRDDGVLVAVAGELDIATCGRLAAALEPHRNDPVVLDIGGCSFVDSSGVYELLSAARANPQLRIRDDFMPAVAQTLEVVGLLRVLPITPAG
jgi:anti-anti-sigma factor